MTTVVREHEVAYLRLRDIVETEHSLEIGVRVSKTSPRKVKVPFGSCPTTCPVRARRAWTEAAGLSDPDAYAGSDTGGLAYSTVASSPRSPIDW
ncbi:hypothetical protein ABZ851_12825 [Streptomyces sp. NPDC047049]|uniref:hypothetical protein n=1 Tax=Streptomyces sp. NPDC047049 TaxID=3156688 RepID=UPI0033FDB339